MNFFRRKRIYLDYASAPPVCREAEDAIAEASGYFGNPGAIHAEGVEAKRMLEGARERIAACLGCKSREVIFTSGLTEANNLAILGVARALDKTLGSIKETHWIVSSIEHDSVLECFAEIERLGGEVTHLEPDERGRILPEVLSRALRATTVLVSVGWANNEIGTVQDLPGLSRAISEYESKHASNIIFHADAGQAPLYLSTTVHSLGVDLLSLGSNKLYGPHGIGALFVGNRLKNSPEMIAAFIVGGKQERGLRAGTESIALASGFATAFEKAVRERKDEAVRVENIRDKMAEEFMKIPGILINGDLRDTLPHMLNISIPNIQSEYLTLALDHAGIAISTKSACREGEESRSHVVGALGGAEWRAQNTLRLSLGLETSIRDVRYVAKTLIKTLGNGVNRPS